MIPIPVMLFCVFFVPGAINCVIDLFPFVFQKQHRRTSSQMPVHASVVVDIMDTISRRNIMHAFLFSAFNLLGILPFSDQITTTPESNRFPADLISSHLNSLCPIIFPHIYILLSARVYQIFRTDQPPPPPVAHPIASRADVIALCDVMRDGIRVIAGVWRPLTGPALHSINGMPIRAGNQSGARTQARDICCGVSLSGFLLGLIRKIGVCFGSHRKRVFI